MYYTIYKTTNTINNKHYIGKHQTTNLDDGYLGSGKHFRRAINKHGIESFKKEILHVFETEAEMNAKERELVTEEFCSRSDTYNMCVGGKGGFSYINSKGLHKHKNRPNAKLHAERMKTDIKYREKTLAIILANLDREKSAEAIKKKYPNGIWFGKTHSEASKQKMKISQQGKQIGVKNSQYGTRWRWINNGIELKKIKAIDIIPEGWYYGGLKKS